MPVCKLRTIKRIFAKGELMRGFTHSLLLSTAVLALSGCGGGSASYSLLSEGENFQQNASSQDTRLDVLFVIDNSGSMGTSQTNLANNFPSFIQKFSEKNYDFQIAVTTTDAYLSLPAWASYYGQSPTPSAYEGLPQEYKARFRDGRGTTHSGFYVLTPSVPNYASAFITNVMQGTSGNGDERSFQSFRAALDSTLNPGFVRLGGFLSIILVTDEDDFSHDDTDATVNYSDARLHSINSYVSYLDQKTLSNATNRRYSVNTLAIPDAACKTQLNNGAQKIGVRVQQLADATNGVKASLCGDFSEELAKISTSIVELSTQFYLNAIPIEETIVIRVNGAVVPSAGWAYNAGPNSISFKGEFVPPQGAAIQVSFDPKSLTF